MSTETQTTEDLLNAEELAESLTGFDQIAIRQNWHQRFDELAEDGVMLLRAMLFVHLRRQGTPGPKADRDAYNQAMELRLNELQDRFESTGGDDDDPEDETATEERDREFAEFVIASGLSYTVEQYMGLTLQQRGHVLDVASKRR